MATKLMKCDCKHEAQDKMHGVGNRLHNSGAKGWSCCVCAKTKGEAVEKKEVKAKAKK